MEEAVSKVADAAYKLDRATYGSYPPEITPKLGTRPATRLLRRPSMSEPSSPNGRAVPAAANTPARYGGPLP